MVPAKVRKDFGLGFLARLTASKVPYAVQRNCEEIAAGTFKDIDLIAPRGSFVRIISVLESFQAVNAISVTHYFSRSQCLVDLADEASRVQIDIDYQVTLTNDCLWQGRGALMLARTVVFSDLVTRQRIEAGMKITVLELSSELLLLRNHALRKSKSNYLNRIALLEKEGIRARRLAFVFRIRGLNLLRRYVLVLHVIPRWITYRLRLNRAPWKNTGTASMNKRPKRIE